MLYKAYTTVGSWRQGGGPDARDLESSCWTSITRTLNPEPTPCPVFPRRDIARNRTKGYTWLQLPSKGGLVPTNGSNSHPKAGLSLPMSFQPPTTRMLRSLCKIPELQRHAGGFRILPKKAGWHDGVKIAARSLRRPVPAERERR